MSYNFTCRLMLQHDFVRQISLYNFGNPCYIDLRQR
nr:MAG TPA: hypothetical protein [Inoviridae sp.]DAI38670.1 MAG TPA: hypothetical protein [Inoviridae sp.]